ncbi:tetratricopeptide tpr_1 repeat-containing protein [Riemerella anatipestifer]|nr:tetratricopeptide tpr_1 repeat-containing protein [Riemerella anatipestifer]
MQGQGSYNALSYKGNREYDSKNYDKASSYFLEAIKKKQDFGGYYNLGNTLYKREMYSEAKAEYQKALSLAKTKEDKMAALYNLGNAEMKAQNYDKAAEFYKKALQQDPYNESIRKNYNISKLKQKEKNQSKSNNKSQNQNSEQDKSQDNQQKNLNKSRLKTQIKIKMVELMRKIKVRVQDRRLNLIITALKIKEECLRKKKIELCNAWKAKSVMLHEEFLIKIHT